VTTSLRDYPRVILASKDRKDEVRESKRMGFQGGNFYIINDYNSRSYSSVWAWMKGSYTIRYDLLDQLATKAK